VLTGVTVPEIVFTTNAVVPEMAIAAIPRRKVALNP